MDHTLSMRGPFLSIGTAEGPLECRQLQRCHPRGFAPWLEICSSNAGAEGGQQFSARHSPFIFRFASDPLMFYGFISIAVFFPGNV